MFNLALLLFTCWFAVLLLWLSPFKRELGRDRPTSWLPQEIPKLRRQRKPDVELERSLAILAMKPQKFRLLDLAAMAGMGAYELAVTQDLISALLYALIGRMFLRAYLALKAAHKQQLQDAQTLQFVRGIKDNLSIESNLLEAVRSAAQQLKDPMRGELLLALNSTRGNRTLPEAIKEVGVRLYNPVYTQLSRIIDKGLKEGQRETAFAFEQVEKSLREGEKVANKRAGKIRSYLKLLTVFILFGLATPVLELLLRGDVWQATTEQTHWAWSIGAAFDLALASGFKKFTRLYVRRGGLALK